MVGTCQFLSGRPALIHTNAFFSVPLPLTITSSDFCGAEACALVQTGLADISIVFIVGWAPSNATLPVTVPPLASSGIAAAPPPAGVRRRLGASVLVSLPPHPASASTQASPAPIQIFFML